MTTTADYIVQGDVTMGEDVLLRPSRGGSQVQGLFAQSTQQKQL